MDKEWLAINSIDALLLQLDAILDLIMCNDNADNNSIKTAADMCCTLSNDIKVEVEILNKYIKDHKEFTSTITVDKGD